MNSVLIRKIKSLIVRIRYSMLTKEESECDFWEKEIEDIVSWACGDIELWGNRLHDDFLIDSSKDVPNLIEQSLMLWLEKYQMPKYLSDLHMVGSNFTGKTVVDIGSGPFPSMAVLNKCNILSLDPLINDYRKMGYMINVPNNTYLQCDSENICLPDNSVDLIVSVNALDHVNNFEKTCLEMKRILKPSGKIRLHLHYHPSTKSEPIELTDERVLAAIGRDLKMIKISESRKKYGYSLPSDQNELFVLWSNFE